MAPQCFVPPAPLSPSLLPRPPPRLRRGRPMRRPAAHPCVAATARFSPTGLSSGGGDARRLGPRPDAPAAGPPFIPQTMEYAIRQAQAAVTDALLAGDTRLSVELPMGRSRKHWYRMSPLGQWYAEAASHALHFAELFRGLRVCVVLATEPAHAAAEPPDWVADVRRLADGAPPRAPPELSGDAGRTVVLVAAAAAAQRDDVLRLAAQCDWAETVVLLNCFLDAPLCASDGPFRSAYACRALDKVAVLRGSTRSAWSVFVEIAVFEYEWVGDRTGSVRDELCDDDDDDDGNGNGNDEVVVWTPTQSTVEQFAIARGATRKALSAYYHTGYSGCEAGFWPFMTLACRDVRPLDGAAMERAARARQAKNKSTRPFGFF